MKKLLLFVIAIATFQFTQAQTKIGIKGGANFSTYVGSDVENAKMLTGFHAGLFANLPITDMIRIQPEVFYSVQGIKTTFLGVDATSKQEYINIPILLQLKASGFFAEIGPQIGFLMASKLSNDVGSFDTKDLYTSSDIGACLGAGFKFESGLGIGARYTMGLTSIDGFDDNVDNDIKNSVISLGLLYTFGNE